VHGPFSGKSLLVLMFYLEHICVIIVKLEAYFLGERDLSM
jgi:hypothetical protein